MFVFLSDCRKNLKKLLYEGTTVLVDRYAFSGVAFTAAKEVCIVKPV